MTPEEKALLLEVNRKLNDLINVYYRTNFPDNDVFFKKVTFKGGVEFPSSVVSLGVSSGTIGFYGETPVIQANAIASPSTPSGAYVQAEAASMKTAIDAIRAALSGIGITA